MLVMKVTPTLFFSHGNSQGSVPSLDAYKLPTVFWCPFIKEVAWLALDTLLWSVWHMAHLPISLCFFIVSFWQGMWNTSQLFIFITVPWCSEWTGICEFHTFFLLHWCWRTNLPSGLHSLRRIEGYDFYAKFSKPRVHILRDNPFEQMGFDVLVYCISLWTETAKTRG